MYPNGCWQNTLLMKDDEMKIISGWDSSGIMQGELHKKIDVSKLKSDEYDKIKSQYDIAMEIVPMWPILGGTVNLGHRHFIVVPDSKQKE